MKYCSHCGAEVHDEAVVCVNCGCKVTSAKTNRDDDTKETMKTLILVFLIIGCVVGAFSLLIPLAWCLPITLSIKRRLENNEPVSTSLKVCALLFVNLVAGILLLCLNDKEDTI